MNSCMFRGKYQKLTYYIPGVPQKANTGGGVKRPPPPVANC